MILVRTAVRLVRHRPSAHSLPVKWTLLIRGRRGDRVVDVDIRGWRLTRHTEGRCRQREDGFVVDGIANGSGRIIDGTKSSEAKVEDDDGAHEERYQDQWYADVDTHH